MSRARINDADSPIVQGYIRRLNELRRAAWALKFYSSNGRDLADLRDDKALAQYRDIEFARALARRQIKRDRRRREAIAKYERRASTGAYMFLRPQAH